MPGLGWLKTALVTGAARGIGRAAAERCRRPASRSRAWITSRREVVYDLTDLAGIPRLIAYARPDRRAGQQRRRADCRRNRRATPRTHGGESCRQPEAPVELIKAVSKQMMRRQAGASSTSARSPHSPRHTDLWYGATKAGVVSFTRSFAGCLGPKGIQVNAVAPGPIDTAAARDARSPSAWRQLMKVVYTRRKGKPEEVAEAIRWLGPMRRLSSTARWSTSPTAVCCGSRANSGPLCCGPIAFGPRGIKRR